MRVSNELCGGAMFLVEKNVVWYKGYLQKSYRRDGLYFGECVICGKLHFEQPQDKLLALSK